MAAVKQENEGSKTVNRIITMDFRTVNFGLLKDLFRGIPWARALEEKGIEERWLIFKHQFLHTQDLYILMS